LVQSELHGSEQRDRMQQRMVMMEAAGTTTTGVLVSSSTQLTEMVAGLYTAYGAADSASTAAIDPVEQLDAIARQIDGFQRGVDDTAAARQSEAKALKEAAALEQLYSLRLEKKDRRIEEVRPSQLLRASLPSC
jgi:hypothetical protein